MSKDFKVGDLIYVSGEFYNREFHASSPALIVDIDKLVITTLIDDKIYKWTIWDLEEAIV